VIAAGLFDSTNALIVGLVVAVAIYVAVLYVAVAFWVVRDARRRSESWFFAVFAGLLGLFLPFLGVIIYMVVRPPRTLDEERALYLEEQALQESEPLDATPMSRPCPTCGREIEPDFVICPYCRTQFARRCNACGKWLRLGWHLCPYCAEEVGVQGFGRSGRAASS
jgi:hypothetical protein